MKNTKITPFEVLDGHLTGAKIALGGIKFGLKVALGIMLICTLLLFSLGDLKREVFAIVNMLFHKMSCVLNDSLPLSLSQKWHLYLYDFGMKDWQELTIAQMCSNSSVVDYIEMHWFETQAFLLWAISVSSLITIVSMCFGVWWINRQAKQTSEEKHIRGAKLLSVKEMNQTIKQKKLATSLPFGELLLPISVECRHSLIIGSSGSGKTVLMMKLMDTLLKRGEKIVLHDYKGDYIEKLYNPDRDYIFNPFDERSIGWSLFDAMETEADIATVARSIIPPTGTKDPFFEDAARGLLVGIFHHLFAEGNSTYLRINEILAMDRIKMMNLLRKSQASKANAASTYLKEQNATAGSILSTLRNQTGFFSNLQDGESFQMENWLFNDQGILFLSNNSKTQSILQPILTIFLDTLTKKLLAQPDQDPKQVNKTVFLLDEIGRMGKLDSIEDLLTQSRSKGGAVILAMQDLAQIERVYGRESKDTFTNNCATLACFSLSNDREAETFSRMFGDQEVERIKKSRSLGSSEMRDGINLTPQQSVEKLILPSELLNLPALEFYLKIPEVGITKTKVKPMQRDNLNQGFIERKGLSLKDIYAQPEVKSIEAEQIEKEQEDDIDPNNFRY